MTGVDRLYDCWILLTWDVRTCHDSVLDAEFFLDSKWSTQSTQSTQSQIVQIRVCNLDQHPVAFSHWQFAWGAKLVRSQRLGNELWTVHSSDLGVFLVRWNSPGSQFFRKYFWELSTWTSFSTCLSLSPARLASVDSSFCYHSGFWWDCFHMFSSYLSEKKFHCYKRPTFLEVLEQVFMAAAELGCDDWREPWAEGGRSGRCGVRPEHLFSFFLCFFPLPSFHPFPVFWNLFFTSHFALLSAAKRAAWRPWMVPNRNTVVGSERTTASRNSRRTSRRRFESSAWKVRPGWEFWTFWKKVLCIGYSGYIL